ncbi:MAG TPA: hypothetical protein QGF58_21550 [Myxococcota bacterium]|nr:hypothetical protein [Myxococcota bacterium]
MARLYRPIGYHLRRPVCVYCQGVFRAHRRDARHCSAACRQAARRARRRQPADPDRRRTRSSLYRATRSLTPHERERADARARQGDDDDG